MSKVKRQKGGKNEERNRKERKKEKERKQKEREAEQKSQSSFGTEYRQLIVNKTARSLKKSTKYLCQIKKLLLNQITSKLECKSDNISATE